RHRPRQPQQRLRRASEDLAPRTPHTPSRLQLSARRYSAPARADGAVAGPARLRRRAQLCRPRRREPEPGRPVDVFRQQRYRHALGRGNGVPKLVLPSPSSLYGAHTPMPFREDADTNRPLSPYAASKKAAETLCYPYHHLYRLDVSVLRFFTVYGPAGRPEMSLFRFVQKISEDRPITVFGDGTQ